MNASNGWYVAVGDAKVGPVSTELVVRGIEHQKIPLEAFVCDVDGSDWVPLSAVAAFHAAVVQSYPPPAPDSEEAQLWMEQGFRFPLPGGLPKLALPADGVAGPAASGAAVENEVPWDPGDEVLTPRMTPPPPPMGVDEAARANGTSNADIHVDVDVSNPAGGDINWSHRFQSYFYVDGAVELPDEKALLESLSSVSRDTFRQEEALWNLALCLAFGSEKVGTAAARAFFDVVTEEDSEERLAWMSRVLLAKGFVPSGIPPAAGRLAFRRLQSLCPPALTPKLPRLPA
jgi:hypothetical protein